ncbi:MAG: hypothetical protein HYY63_03470, partial [Elusimicrobia bacterium]|nr:hypothetical protein [Elusimicrobiota bacterium]
SADHSLANIDQEFREDENRGYRTGSSYSFPWQPDFLPTRFLTFKPLPTSVSYSFNYRESSKRLTLENTDTGSNEESHSMRTSFQPFPRFNFSPSYSRSKTSESRNQLDLQKSVSLDLLSTLEGYDKTFNQNAGLSGSLRLTSWLTPSFNYSISTNETYNVNEVIFGTETFKRGRLKNINRSSNADVSGSVSPRDIFQYIPFVRSINPLINSMNFSGGYTVSDADTYDNMNSNFDSRYESVIRDKSLDLLLIRDRSLDTSRQNSHARRTNLTATDSPRISGRWSPFEGLHFLRSKLWSPMKNINTTGTFTESKTKRDTTGTQSFSYSRVWPDFVVSTYELERVFFLTRWMSDTRLNANYQERITEVRDQTRNTGFNIGSDFTFTLFRLLQFSAGYTNAVSQDENLQINQVTSKTTSKGFNGQVITTLKWGNWRFTPRYDQNQSETEDGRGKKTSDIVNRNAALQIYGDINVPRFFRLPLGKQLKLSNRLILTSSIRYSMVRNGVDETGSRDTLDSGANGDLEITPNVRVNFGGSYSRIFNKVKKEDDLQTITFSTTITIQF